MTGTVTRDILCLVMMLWSRFIITTVSLCSLVLFVKKLGPVLYIVNVHSGSQRKCYIDQSHRQEVLTETSTKTQPNAVSSDTTSKLNDDDAIEIIQPAKESVT